MSNEVTTIQSNEKSLMAAQRNYILSIGRGLSDLIGNMTPYQANCGYNILNAINVALAKDGLNYKSPNVDKESINDAIRYAVIYQLNTDNKEVFIIVRNEKRNGSYIKKIEYKPQYRGHIKILSSYGKDVEKVYPEWIVREGDEFTYPQMRGIEAVPPIWTRKSQEGKVRLVVVPIKYKDGYVEYRIAERESVATNIKAQIKQSVMFDNKKDQILELIKDMTLDQLLTEKSISEYVNDTYTGLSSEEMIITKLIINATKRVAIDYGNAIARELIEKTYDNSNEYRKESAAEIIGGNIPQIEREEPIAEIEEQDVQNDVPSIPQEYEKDDPSDLASLFPKDKD